MLRRLRVALAQAMHRDAIDEEERREVTTALVGRLESVVILVQAVSMTIAAAFDSFTDVGRAILYLLAVVHFAFAAFAFMTRGPFSRGGWWVAGWLIAAVAMPVVTGTLVPAGGYAASKLCVTQCQYPALPLVVVAFYPWISLKYLQLRRPIVALIFALIFVTTLGVAARSTGGLVVTWTTLISVGSSMAWCVTAYAAGLGIAQMCRTAVKVRSDALEKKYGEMFDYLHTDIDTAIAGIRKIGTEGDDKAVVLEELDKLSRQIRVERVQSLLWKKLVPLAPLLINGTRTFERQVSVDLPHLDFVLNLPRQIATLFDSVLRALLKNVWEHGGGYARIDLIVENDEIHLTVEDKGPGVSPAVLDQPKNGLFHKRQEVVQNGGDLQIDTSYTTGARFTLRLPIRLRPRSHI